MKSLLYIAFCAIAISCSKEGITELPFEIEENLETQFNSINLNDYLAKPTIDVPEGTLFYQNIPYGEGQRQVIDLFIPKIFSVLASYESLGIVLSIHGGGFMAGDKGAIYQTDNDIYQYLDNNTAFISMNYRFIEEANPDNLGVLKCFNDSERVLSFIQFLSNQTNLDPNNIFIKGESSGAGIAQYLIAKPVYSNRIKGVSLNAPQSTYDFLQFNKLFKEFNFDLYQYLSFTNLENRVINFYGGSQIEQLEDDPIIVNNRVEVSLLNIFDSYEGTLRIKAGNVGVPYNSLSNINELLHHQIHAIDIYNKALNANIFVDAQIPYLNLESNLTELEFILESLNQ